MHIIIAHSHLNPGGVTRIIESQIKSLGNQQITVIFGGSPAPNPFEQQKIDFELIDTLNYLENKVYSDEEARTLLHKIHCQIKKHLSDESILHFHNLNLGKNPLVTYAVYLLAKEGYKVFNHAHDFAEDRPDNYKFLENILYHQFGQKVNEVLYPKLSNYHYGVLNSFDYQRLQSLGVEKERILWLPNPVSSMSQNDISESVKKLAREEISDELGLDNSKLLVTYPVRVIKRKNIGEFILLSVLFRESTNFVVTQPPQNPVEIALYEQWLSFCKDQNIEITFEAGTKVNFEKLLIGSDYCITTSYKEGFGMVYLEPWLLNTPVVGRDIDFITKDFRADGFEFPALYSKLYIDSSRCDFKDLSMDKQMQFIAAVKNDLKLKNILFEQNPTFGTLFKKVEGATINKNISIIKNNYSLKGYGIKLQERYKTMAG